MVLATLTQQPSNAPYDQASLMLTTRLEGQLVALIRLSLAIRSGLRAISAGTHQPSCRLWLQPCHPPRNTRLFGLPPGPRADGRVLLGCSALGVGGGC